MADFQDFNDISTCDEEIDDEVVQNEKVVHKEEKKTSATGKRKKTVKKWTTEDTNRLIDLFEERPCLWDIFQKDYHCREKKESAYNEIKDILGVGVCDIKSRLISYFTGRRNFESK